VVVGTRDRSIETRAGGAGQTADVVVDEGVIQAVRVGTRQQTAGLVVRRVIPMRLRENHLAN
jgi:hypothetical protein